MTRGFRYGLLFAFVMFSLPHTSVRADSLAETFARGHRAFEAEDYASAVREYERLLEAGVDDPDVTFDLACAHGALGHDGQAIRYFERTLRLRPDDAAAQKALGEVRSSLAERTAQLTGEAIVSERPPLAEALFARLTTDGLSWTLLCATWLACLTGFSLFWSAAAPPASTLRLRSEGLRLAFGIVSGVATCLALLAGFGLGTRLDWGRSLGRAVVISAGAPLRQAPDPGSPVNTELAEGTSARVIAHDGAFARVKSGPYEGYVRADQLGDI
jgi:hypothetical protein